MVALVTVENLSMDFNGFLALKDINFELNEGEIVGVIGRSGAGKTVLMHLLRGIDNPPTTGRIVYHVALCDSCEYVDVASHAGQKCRKCGGNLEPADVDFWNDENERLKRRIMRSTAIMFQRTFALYGDDRVIDNVMHALYDVNYPSEDSINRAADLIDEVNLSHRMMHIARDLSGGEKQRVVLARQLAKEPFLLFADEPTGTLDPDTADLVHEMLIDCVKKNNMAMMVSSHFSQVITDVADRAILLEEGEVTLDGDPRSVIDKFARDIGDKEIYSRCETGSQIMIGRDVEKRYFSVDRGVIKALDGVSFDIAEKEIFGIIGLSGAGKTTLSRIIAGEIEPTAGGMEIKIGDEWVDMTKRGIDNRGRAKKYIGLLHQEYDLYPHRNVLDNLTDSIGLEFPKELALRKAIITLRMAGFTEEKSRQILKRLPDQLSAGERHRVALAQVLIREPRIVLLDEPTGTMDMITKKDVQHSIMTSREEMEETFIVVSHDLEFVKDICDRVALMRGGKIRKMGTVSEVLTDLTEEEKSAANIE